MAGIRFKEGILHREIENGIAVIKPEVNALYGPYSDLTTGADTVYNTLGA